MIGDLLEHIDRRPVLVDVGSAGGPPPIWSPLAPWASYVAFEAEASSSSAPAEGFRQAFSVRGAAVADAQTRTVPLHVTAALDCSSLLRPDRDALSHFL